MKIPPSQRQEKIAIIQEIFKKSTLDQLKRMHGNNWKFSTSEERMKRLNIQSDHELDCILAKTEEYKCYYRQLSEKRRFFHQSDCDADFAYWGKQIVWSIEEGIALILGKDPRKVFWENIKEYVNYSPFAKSFEEIQLTAKRYTDFQQLSDPVTPPVFLTWVQRMSFANVMVPLELIKSVTALGIQLVDWQELYKGVEKNCNKIKEQYNEAIVLIDNQKELIQSLKQEIELLNISPNSESTLLGIIGVLVKTMFTVSPGGHQLSAFDSQTALIEFLVNNFSKVKGISKSTLESKFSKGEKLLK